MIETDILIIGAGPTGLFTVFEAGLLQLKCHIIDALPQPGGQLAELYPKKPIFDIPGYPEVLAGDLVTNLMEQIKQFQPGFTLAETAETIEKLEDMGVDNPVERAIEFGKDPKISQENKKKGSDMKIRLQEKETFRRIQKEQMAKIIEDILVNKKNKKDIVDKKKGREVFTKSEIIDLIKKNEPIDNIDKVIKSSREQ